MGSQPRQRRQNIAVGGAKPRLVRRSASARRWKRLSETHGCNQNDFSGRLALSGREQSPRPLNAKRPQGPATPQPWVTLRACRRSLHPRLCSFAPTALSFRRKRLFAFQEGLPLKRACQKGYTTCPVGNITLNKGELGNWKSQIAISKSGGATPAHHPYLLPTGSWRLRSFWV